MKTPQLSIGNRSRRRGARVAPNGRGIRRHRLLWLEPLEQRCLLSAGALDPTFGTRGKVLTNLFNANVDEFAHDVAATQSDGKILVAGNTKTSDSFGGFFVLARYNNDGSLDTTFGQAGKATTSFGAVASEAWAMAVQPDGKILVAGSCVTNQPADPDVSQLYDSNRVFALARYHGNGNLDTGFGSGGLVITDFGTGSDVAQSVAVDANGKIVFAGSTQWSGGSDLAVARYNSGGTLDGGFGSAGKVTTDVVSGKYDFG